MRVLLIENDIALAKIISTLLVSNGMVCDTTSLGEDGIQIAQSTTYDYDIIILEILLPDINGYEIICRLRATGVDTPVLILSSLGGSDNKVKGLKCGADDYMTKPFDKAELLARIKAIIRRARGHPNKVIRTGRLSVDLDARSIKIDNKPLRLTGTEYSIIEFLSLRKGSTVTRQMFLNHLYGGLDEPELKVIDIFICKLRRKLRAAMGGESYIKTDWGNGYRLRDPPVVSDEMPATG